MSDLTDCISRATEHNARDVTHRARRLREAGLIPTGGRGRGGAQMEPIHGARLLIAVLWSGDAIRSAEAAARIGTGRSAGVVFRDLRRPVDIETRQFLDETFAIPADKPFEEVLADLIEDPVRRAMVSGVGVIRTGPGLGSGYVEVAPSRRERDEFGALPMRILFMRGLPEEAPAQAAAPITEDRSVPRALLDALDRLLFVPLGVAVNGR